MFEMGEHDTWFGEFVEPDLVFIQPVSVWLAVADVVFDFFIADDTSLFKIDHEHFTGLESSFFFDQCRIYGQGARLAGHDDTVVGGDAVSGGAESVSIQGGSDDASVGERNGCGSVPWFHHRGVVLIECLADRIHHVVVVPGFRDEHHHDVRKRSAGHTEQFDHIVEACTVRLSLAHDGQQHIHFLACEER